MYSSTLVKAGTLQQGSAPRCRGSDPRDERFELGQPAVPEEVTDLGHGNGDDAAVGIVEPCGAVAAAPAVAAGDWPVRVRLGDDAHTETPPAATQYRSRASHLLGRQMVGRHQLDRPLRQQPFAVVDAVA